MKLKNIEIDMETIKAFCDRWQVIEFGLFGSVLRDDFHDDSDIDVIVKFHPEARPKFSTLDNMEDELKTIFNRDVDVITRNGVERSLNYLRRNEILSSVKVIYATGQTISA